MRCLKSSGDEKERKLMFDKNFVRTLTIPPETYVLNGTDFFYQRPELIEKKSHLGSDKRN